MKEIYVIEAYNDIIWTFETKEKALGRFELIIKQHPDAKLFSYVKYEEINLKPKKTRKVIYCDTCDKAITENNESIIERHTNGFGNEYFCSQACARSGFRTIEKDEYSELPWIDEAATD